LGALFGLIYTNAIFSSDEELNRSGRALTHSLPMSEILNSILNDVRSSRNFQDNLIMLCQDDLGHQR
jgi:hypothetical protein